MKKVKTTLNTNNFPLIELKNNWKINYFLILTCLFVFSSYGQTIQVNSINKLENAISEAVPGNTIILQNGTYTTTDEIAITNKKGTASKPIVIKAESIGGVTIRGEAGFNVKSNSEYIVIEGFIFKHEGVTGLSNSGSYCKFTRNVFECVKNRNTGTSSYLKIFGPNNEISYNTFRNKDYLGPMLSMQGPNNEVAQNNWVHHNYFDNFPDFGENNNSAIQPGYKNLIESRAYLTIEHNLFNKLNADSEGVISVKCWNVTFRHNTVIDSRETCLRQGNESEVYGNYFFGGTGVRLSDDDHKIYNNTFVNVETGIKVFSRIIDDGANHEIPDRTFIGFNTMINSENGIWHDGTHGSRNTSIVNNIYYNCEESVKLTRKDWTSPVIKGNIIWNSGEGELPSSGYEEKNPLFNIDSNGVPHLKANSPVIGQAIGNYSFIDKDIDGQPRTGSKDIGSDQYNTSATLYKPLTKNDVGPNADLGIDNNQLPTVSLTNPSQDNQEFTLGDTITLGANASDPDGNLDYVNFKLNGSFYKKDRDRPFSVTWTPTTAGTYTIGARAFDTEGLSEEVTRIVIIKDNNNNEPPTVSLTNPSQNNQEFILGETIVLEANASDPDGNLDYVNFKLNGSFYKKDRDRPFSVTWTPTLAGTYTIGARAFDTEGLSEEVTRTVIIKDNNSNSCSFGTPANSGLSAMDKVVYNNVHLLGDDGPKLSNFRKFTINWVPSNNSLYQFGINTNNGTPDWYIDFKNTMTYQLKNAQPEITLNNTGFEGLDGSYWVTRDGNNFVLVSKTKDFSLYFNNSSSTPGCNRSSGIENIEEKLLVYPNPIKDNVMHVRGLNSKTKVLQIVDLQGRIIKELNSTNTSETMDVSELPSGPYLLINTSKNSKQSFLFIK
ncbi:chondroitinase-B domain-containing protein [uncultured Aquimarina sp.]|uniref:Ig-like domain-containing protein n=1 Tax=uncultured Aquimarina sp. TaxID=575652 RepID=UPI00260D5149|nr:chondroitinase-B domain-containing protein [uncultured Aquimarina sp.]